MTWYKRRRSHLSSVCPHSVLSLPQLKVSSQLDVKALRAVRVLRPLKLISGVPSESFCPSFCLTVYPSVCRTVCRACTCRLPALLSLCLTVCLHVLFSVPVCLSVCPSLYLSVCLPVFINVSLSVPLSVCRPSMCLSLCPSICLPLFLSWNCWKRSLVSPCLCLFILSVYLSTGLSVLWPLTKLPVSLSVFPPVCLFLYP